MNLKLALKPEEGGPDGDPGVTVAVTARNQGSQWAPGIY